MKWESKALEQLCIISKGKKHTESAFSKTSFRYVQIEDLHGTNEYRYTTEKGVDCTQNDVLIAWDGANAGKVGTGLIGMVGSTLARLRLVSDKIYTRYLYWFLESKSTEIKSQRTGATIPHVNGGVLRSMKIPLPPVHIQKQIADTLDTADTLRARDKDLLTKYNQLAQSVFYDMFGDPEINEKGWKITKLQLICDDVVDCPHSTPQHTTDKTKYPCIRTSELINGFIRWSTMKYVDTSEYEKRTSRLVPQAGDIVYGREGSYGEAVLLPEGYHFCLGQRTMLFRPTKEVVDNMFLWWQLRSDFVYDQARKKNSGSTVGHVNVADIKKFNIILPPLRLQRTFNEWMSRNICSIRQVEKNLRLSNLFIEKTLSAMVS